MLNHLVILTLFLFIGVSSEAVNSTGVNWALLVAGSNEFYNYRHQADVCHAYQIVKKYGIPDERIVVMMYDDIAHNEENPTKGIIINRPNGSDVYAGVLKDYTKDHVTPKNFLNVLQGIKTDVGSKKVINSGPNDNVFVFFADHGAPGLIAFPDGTPLHANQLNSAIKKMHIHKKYKKLVFYMEACESGSMFDNLLPENINVYATTASNPNESSYACYFDDERQTYLGDLYSVNWMENSEKSTVKKETLINQFQIVKKKTNLSHVMEYGNLTMGKVELVIDFIGEKNKNFIPLPISASSSFDSTFGAVKTEDVRMSILQKKLKKETNQAKREKILAEIEKANYMNRTAVYVIRKIASYISKTENFLLTDIIEKKNELRSYECYEASVNRLVEKCFNLNNEYVLRNLYILVNLCESKIKSDRIIESIDIICKQKFS